VSDASLRREDGIRKISRFFWHFHGEDVVVRPASADREPFTIEVLLSGNEATFSPQAPVYEGDIVERADPRGGVIEYIVEKYEISKDPFKHGNDHGKGTLRERGHAARAFGATSIVIHGGTNQVSIGHSNALTQTVGIPAAELVGILSQIRSSIPRGELSDDAVREVTEASDAADEAVREGKPRTVRRALYGLKGVIDEIGQGVEEGAKAGVKTWAAATAATLLAQIANIGH
jgi:hypothetical protein